MKTRYLRFIGLVINNSIRSIIWQLSSFVPKKAKRWVFGSWYGKQYSDNPRRVFEYVTRNKIADAIWLTKSTAIAEHLAKAGYNVAHCNSLRGIWAQMTAEVVFVNQSIDADLNSAMISRSSLVVQLWHGIPIKKIMSDCKGHYELTPNWKGRVQRALSRYRESRVDLLIATNARTQRQLANAFGVPLEKTRITGLPRNDVFYASSDKENRKKRCIYMPTFRGEPGDEANLFERYGFNVEVIEEALLALNMELVLRLHPVNRPTGKLSEALEETRWITISNAEDIYQELNDYDILVTDYSSVYIDFLLTGRPIVFATFDLEEYQASERELYYKIEDVTLQPLCRSWPEVINRISEIAQLGVDLDYENQYQRLTRFFHDDQKHEPDSFTKNVIKEVQREVSMDVTKS